MRGTGEGICWILTNLLDHYLIRQNLTLKAGTFDKPVEDSKETVFTEILDVCYEKIKFYDDIPTEMYYLRKKEKWFNSRVDESTRSTEERMKQTKENEFNCAFEATKNRLRLQIDNNEGENMVLENLEALNRKFKQKIEEKTGFIKGFADNIEKESKRIEFFENKMNLTPRIEKMKALKLNADKNKDRKEKLEKEIHNKMRRVNHLKAQLEHNMKLKEYREREYDLSTKIKLYMEKTANMREEVKGIAVQNAMMGNHLDEFRLRLTKGKNQVNEYDIEIEFDEVL